MKRYSLTLNLKNDPELIRQYEEHHKKVWPEIVRSIKNAGIESMEIYRYETRLFMIMEVNDNFSFEKKQKADSENEKVQEWETLMWKYQQPLAGSAEGEKWKLMEKIFELNNFSE
ncbi:MAG: L-rhamnose mutarotase [Ginsengibacter sp.]